MGLDTTHNAWHGPYSSFNEFRIRLANSIGIDLKEYIGYSFKGTKDEALIDHPLMPLFNHSDCDGELTPDECKQIAEGLDMVLKASKLPSTVDEIWFAEKIVKFRDGCLLAYSKKEILEFA